MFLQFKSLVICTYQGGWEDNFCISHTHTQVYIVIYLYIPFVLYI